MPEILFSPISVFSPKSNDTCHNFASFLYSSTIKPASSLFISLAVSKTVIKAINTAFIATAGTTPQVASEIILATKLIVYPVLQSLPQKFSNAEIRFNTYLISYICPYAAFIFSLLFS